MALSLDDCVQREHHFAIVDEVDSILVDEARTPLIISGPAEDSHEWYPSSPSWSTGCERDEHYEVDEKKKHRRDPGDTASTWSRTGWASTTSTSRPTPR